MNKETELAQIDKKIFKLNILGIPGTLLIGLSLHALFAGKGHVLHPALNNSTIVYNMLIFGFAIEAWQLYRLVPLFRMRAKLSKIKDS